MDGVFGMRRRLRRPTINITSLIDVMFLLLIFFMVSSTFREQIGIDITLPVAATATEQQPAQQVITVRADGAILFGPDQAVTAPEQLRHALQELLAADPETVLLLRADEAAAFQDVITVIDIARSVGGSRLIIPTEPLRNSGDP